MAFFSPSLMAEFKTVTINATIGPYADPQAAKPLKFYQWTGTHAAWVELARLLRADPSDAGKSLARNWSRLPAYGLSWCALAGQPEQEFLATGISTAAHSAFQQATAKLHADRLMPGVVKPAIAGGAWVIPLVLAGNPMAARLKERTKLPPLNIDLGITLMARTDADALTRSLAPLAHAAWEYLQAGGVVSLTTHYTWGFRTQQDGHSGVVISIKAPLTNQAAFATAISVQFSRCYALIVGQSLSGVPDGRDGMPLAYWYKPGLHLLNGQGQGDRDALAALRVRT